MQRLAIVSGLALLAASHDAVATWKHKVVIDPMDDSKSCEVSPTATYGAYFWIHYSAQGVYATVIGDKYPGRDVTARIDANPAASGREFISGAALQKIADQLRNGGDQIKVQFIEWPSGAPVMVYHRANNIVAEMNACRAALRR